MKKILITFITILSCITSINCMEKEIAIEYITQEQITLTNELYKPELTPCKLIQLHQQGAVINGKILQSKTCNGYLNYHTEEPLSCWVQKFVYHSLNEAPRLLNNCITSYSDIDEKKEKTIKKLAIIIQLLELGAEPTEVFEQQYANLLKYNLNNREHKTGFTKQLCDKNLERLLKSKPTKIRYPQIIYLWEDIITEENHSYIDLLITYFTPEELQPGLDYCITKHGSILEKFDASHEAYEKYLPDVIQKLIRGGATPNNQLSRIAGDITFNVVNSDEKKINLKILKCLCENGAYTERTVDILERHLEEMEKEQILILATLNRMKQNKLDAASSIKEQ